tara:strand:- start:461 stop:793 length:333 start_codon:yes stop_codon:yes gene_type:complete
MDNMANMTKAKAINMIHNFTSLYLLFGWIIPSQRVNLVLIIPTIQYQFLVNNNMCLLTQLENKYSLEKDKTDSYTDKKLKEYGIIMSKENTEKTINSLIYLSFLVSYSFM